MDGSQSDCTQGKEIRCEDEDEDEYEYQDRVARWTKSRRGREEGERLSTGEENRNGQG